MRGRGWTVVAGVAVGAVALVACTLAEEVATQDVVADIPWAAGEEASYSIWDDDERVGSGVLKIEAQDQQLRLVQEYESADFKDRTTLEVEKATLKPLSGQRVITGEQGELHLAVRYFGGIVEVERTVREDSKEKSRTDSLNVPAHAYDTGSSLFLWRAIAFDEDYQATYVNMATAIVGKAQRNHVTLRVAGRETVEVPAGTFQAWRLEIRSAGVKQTAWYATSAGRPLVKYDNGETVFLLESLK